MTREQIPKASNDLFLWKEQYDIKNKLDIDTRHYHISVMNMCSALTNPSCLKEHASIQSIYAICMQQLA